jgi:hypothetical protein
LGTRLDLSPGAALTDDARSSEKIVQMFAQTNVQLYRQLADLRWSETDIGRARDAYELAFELFSGQYRRSHRTFISHTVGTASIVAEVDGRRELVLAALLHAAYSVGDWGRTPARGANRGMRAEVKNVVGSDAEQLIWRYTSFPRRLEALRSWAEAAATSPSDGLARDLVILRLANQVEELQDYPVAERDLGTLEVLVDSATGFGDGRIADRLTQIAGAMQSIDVPLRLHTPQHRRNVVPPRSYRLASRVRLREQLRRLTPRPIRSWIRRARHRPV